MLKAAHFLIIIIFYLGFGVPSEAIVNIETLRAKKGHGSSHQSELKANGAQGNSENFSIAAGHATAWKWSQSQNFIVLDYGYGESRKIKDTNKFFSHMRHAKNLSEESSLQWELFAQWQYNEFQRLNSRFLLGSGLRETLLNGDQLNIHGGLGAIWYREDISGKNQQRSRKEEGGRWSTYLAAQWKLAETVDLFNTIYFQPHMESLKDHNVLWDFQLKFNSTDWLAVTLSYRVSHDNAPPEGIKYTDSTYLAGLKFSY